MSECCPDPACSHALYFAAQKEASNLTHNECEIILGVLSRDDEIRRNEEHRVLRLKAELQSLRRKGALRPSADVERQTTDSERTCGRCRVELGRVINRGAYCQSCRLKVCKGCREYPFRTPDWVCTVCHKRMEIQVVSGEWMNEFVRRPSRRRDNRVYVPAADIIKRTLRRSWTISSPTPRWNSPRGSQLIRPYSSLPRGQDITKYPSLLSYKMESKVIKKEVSPVAPRHLPAHRSHSEDVYSERNEKESEKIDKSFVSKIEITTRPRVNPLTKAAAEGKLNPPATAFDMKLFTQLPLVLASEPIAKKEKSPTLEHGLEEKQCKQSVEKEEVVEKRTEEKRVSFEESGKNKPINISPKPKTKDKSILKHVSSDESDKNQEKAPLTLSAVEYTDKCDESSNETEMEVQSCREDDVFTEQCDIEPISGTVFRKVTVQRRRQEMRKIPAIDNGWRRGPESDILDILLPEGDDYKLVFISSDSSSKEEDLDDNDSSSTASSFLVDDCDWDYFESSTGTRPFLNWNSPFGSPRVYRRGGLESPLGSPLVYRKAKDSDVGTDEDISRIESGSPASSDRSRETEDYQRAESRMEDVALQCAHQPETVVEPPRRSLCQSCGSPTQYVPIPFPVPIPVPVPALWSPQAPFLRFGLDITEQSLRSRLRAFSRSFWPYVNQTAVLWPFLTTEASGEFSPSTQNDAADKCTPESNGNPPSTEHNKRPAANDLKFIKPITDERTCSTSELFEIVNGGNAGSEDGDAENKSSLEYGFLSSFSEELFGHLTSENANMSSTDSSERSTDEGDSDEPGVRRSYNVNGGDMRESDDALPSSEVSSDSDGDVGRMSQSSVREDDMSSSGSADTDSNDTGTVADQKVKRFSRVLVVNDSSSTSSSDSIIDGSLNSDVDSSDNDTDTEKDCGVVLTNVKLLNDDDSKSVCDKSLNKRENESNINENDFDSLLTDNNKSIVGGDFETNRYNVPLSSTTEMRAWHNNNNCSLNSILNDNNECLSPSPGLSDVSADSHHSTDVDQFAADNNKNFNRIKEDALESEMRSRIDDRVVSEEQHNVSTSPSIRSDESQPGVGNGESSRGERTGEPVASELDDGLHRYGTRYTSLVMITQESAVSYPQVSVVTSDTTTLLPDSDIVVRHTNWQKENLKDDDRDRNSSGYLALQLENNLTRQNEIIKSPRSENDRDITVVASSDAPVHVNNHDLERGTESVTVITGADTLSALVYLEDGLADDDSWVDNLSVDEDDLVATSPSEEDSSSDDEVTLTCTAAIDQDDELGYRRSAIDFTLHTIVEESCEESEVEQTRLKKKRPPSATDLEKYFYFGLGDGNATSINSLRDDGLSETSSICSEGMDSLGVPEEVVSGDSMDPAELASSRLEKYFLSGFMGFTAERRDSDGSVGSDSEGRPSPEQRRKRLVRARGTGRSHSSSLDNLLAHNELSAIDQDNQVNSEDISSSDTDTNEDGGGFDKPEGQFDTVKRKKTKKPRNAVNGSNSSEECKLLESTQEVEESCRSEEDGHKTPQPESATAITQEPNNGQQQSRDSGFIGSCDDLLKEQRDASNDSIQNSKTDLKTDTEKTSEERKSTTFSMPPATSLTRKDSFNNWSSDEETNLMMCKMRQFFKSMIANGSMQNSSGSKPTTPILESGGSPKLVPSPRFKNRYKPPQLVYFESELTRLMKSVPGIRDDQVREIVEYLSSEDTWSDSYDSSDYTSSDLEGAANNKTLLRQQISDSCREIINKFDQSASNDVIDEPGGLSKETAFVYQKLVASLEKMASNDVSGAVAHHTPHSSPPLIAKVMHHIGSRLVALMHEVSSGESHASNSPRGRHYHRRIHPKLSNASSTTTEDDDSTSDNFSERLSNLDETISSYNLLPRSRSHDLLLEETKMLHQSSSGVSDIAEERETSDYERYSWRGSFESALMATDSRNKLSILGSEGSASASALAVAAKRRSAGDLMFNNKSLSREQLDRVRSCGSIGGSNSEDKLWVANPKTPTRRSSVPDAASGSGASADGEDDDDDDEEALENRATLPRSLQTNAATTNSLPRLPTTTTPPTTSMYKAQSMYHFIQQNVKSARYRPPGFNKFTATVPKRAVSAPGLQPSHQRRGRRSQQSVIVSDEATLSETARSSPMLLAKGFSKSATPSPVSQNSRKEINIRSSQEWQSNEDDIDRLVAIQTNRSSLSSLGLRSDSMASVYSGAGEGRYGTVTVRGQVEFGLQYNYKASALEILIKQCKDLAAVDTKRNRSDPYVKVYLLPDKSKSGKRKTKVKKHTLNPVFDECLKFHISLTGLETRTLWLTVWHSDIFGRNDFLGEVTMTLENKVFDDPTPKWYNLQERTEPFEDVLSFKGDILVGLKFIPPDMTVVKKGKRSRGTLHVKVKEAKSLTAVKSNGTSDPFCKSYLLPDKGRTSKQKTAVIRKTINAVWNHTFIYDDVTLQELSERCLELTVWDHDRLGSNEFLGGVRFSLGEGKHYGKAVDWMDSTGKEVSLWKSMLDRPNFWVEGCLPLRPTLDHRTT
ncbi:hypothetical protein FQA39_LY11269 [Lamprigera yunnana]|nr:hypothetical protein FQA39_LY11269 [Lamprigera yunnana]